MNNNIFQYATSELSQDAFICWLLSYAIKDCKKDPILTECAKDFIMLFIPELKNEDIFLSEPPHRQYNSIDVLITVNDKYKVIIEDKTHTSDHDNQLLRYREIVETNFPSFKTVGVYYKIGFQSSFDNVIEANYVICERKDILAILKKYISQTTNNIFIDYYNYLNEFDSRANQFKLLPIKEWTWEQINGFYKYCQENITNTGMNFGFGYVPNKSGGFYGMWIYKPVYTIADGLNCELYLQCEFSNGEFNICYRASTENEKIKKSNRESFIWKCIDGEWINIAKKHNFVKPPHYGTGKSVALGKYVATIKSYKDAIIAIKNAINDFYCLVEDIKPQT